MHEDQFHNVDISGLPNPAEQIHQSFVASKLIHIPSCTVGTSEQDLASKASFLNRIVAKA
jgi:hypothetical protein